MGFLCSVRNLLNNFFFVAFYPWNIQQSKGFVAVLEGVRSGFCSEIAPPIAYDRSILEFF